MFILKQVQNEQSPLVELQKKLGIVLSSSTSQVTVDVLDMAFIICAGGE